MLNLRNVRFIFGSTVLIAHFGTAAVFFVLGQKYLDRPQDVIQGVLTVAPVAAVYSVMFVKYVAANAQVRQSEISESMSGGAFSIQLLILMAFGLALLGGTIFLFERAEFAADDVKLFTGMIDTLFGAYMASIFGKLFPNEILD